MPATRIADRLFDRIQHRQRRSAVALPAETMKMTREEFLVWVETQPGRHEYIGGEVFAMTGARQTHVIVAGNCYAGLRERLKGTPCRAYVADMAVEVAENEAVVYPDVVVSCHPEDKLAERAIKHPKVVIEILSPSTAAYDRGEKFALYRSVAHLAEYVLVDPDARKLEIFRRTESGDWLLAINDSTRALVLHSLSLELPLELVFEDLVPLASTG